MAVVRRLLREPLLHFLLLGAVIFALLGRGGGAKDGGEIVVSQADIGRIGAGFAATWQRPPSTEELQSAINDYIREEVLYRAGLDLGLDRDDIIVRRRIGQKMSFFLEGTVEPPTETDLKDFVDRHPEKFRTDPRIAFRQVFVSSKRRDARGEAEAMLPKLISAGSDTPSTGDPTLLPDVIGPRPLRDIALQFSADFAHALLTLRPGVWSGPVASPYGYHLVLVESIEPARLPAFDDVRSAAEREWYAEQRATVLQTKYDELRSRYRVRVEDGGAQ